MTPAYARVLLEVIAGLVPEQAMPEYTQQWGITEQQWQQRETDPRAKEVEVECDEYAEKLRAGGLNWVQTTWIYL